jgi:hypothetical protein
LSSLVRLKESACGQNCPVTFVFWRGLWLGFGEVVGLERFGRIPTKKPYGRATDEMIDDGVLVGDLVLV